MPERLAGRSNYLEGYTGFDMIRRAAAIAGGWGWCEEHGESFKDHDHGDQRADADCVLELDGRGPSVHDDDFEWEKVPTKIVGTPSLDYCPKWGDHHASRVTGHKHGVIVRGNWLWWRRYRICPACDWKERIK